MLFKVRNILDTIFYKKNKQIVFFGILLYNYHISWYN